MKTDICIVGGGIMGLATAYHIIKTSNSRVLVLDRYGVGNEYCSSNDINRVFRYSYGNDKLYTSMAVESRKLWKELEQESGRQLLIPTGLLLLKGENENANRFNESSFQTLSEMKLGAERYNHDDLEERFSQFRAEEAIFDPNGGVLLASKALQAFNSLAQQKGVSIQRRNVEKITLTDQPYLTTDTHEKVEFERLILTCGPWSRKLIRDGLTPITPTRQQIIYFQPSQLGPFRPESCPVFFTDDHYGLPTAGIDAVKVSPKELDEPADPDTTNRSVDQKQITDCRRACRKFVPDIAEGEVLKTKICFYDMTENSDFVLDRDPDHSPVIYGYGFSGHGFKFAPLIGVLLAQLALDVTPSINLERFSAIPSQRRPTSAKNFSLWQNPLGKS